MPFRRVRDIPWSHNIAILEKVKDPQQRIWYIEKTAENGWSHNVLIHQIESGLYQRQVLADKVVFDDSREDNLKEKLALERREKAEYAKKVGQLTMQVDWLKKKSEETLGPDYESKFSPKPFED